MADFIEQYFPRFLAEHPEWQAETNLLIDATDASRIGLPTENWMRADAVRPFFLWARTKGFITRAGLMALLTALRQTEHHAFNQGTGL
jgi:hypothetical protein